MRLTDKDIRRFWSKVAVGGPDQCWPWKAGKFTSGYGGFYVGGKTRRAHIVAFFLRYGYVPTEDGLVVRHTCGNPACCNPSHLVDGSQRENVQDSVRRGTHRAAPRKPYRTEEVFRLKAEGMTQMQIAAQLGITQACVSQVLRRKIRHNRAAA